MKPTQCRWDRSMWVAHNMSTYYIIRWVISLDKLQAIPQDCLHGLFQSSEYIITMLWCLVFCFSLLFIAIFVFWPMSVEVTRQKRDRQNLERQNWDKLTLVVDNVGSCVKSPQILHVLAHIILEDSPRNFGLALKFSQIPITWQSFTAIGDPVKPPLK